MERKKIKAMEGYPIGYRFRPSEHDLFFHYLAKKVEGKMEAIPPFMPEVDIYRGEDPWEMFDANSKESFYIFTRLKMIKSRVKRTAGSGTWNNGNKRKIVDDGGDTVGYNKLFTFKLPTGSQKIEHGHWTMHEYSMIGQELVLCVITNQEVAEKKSSDVITIGSIEKHHPAKSTTTMDDPIFPGESAIIFEASTSRQPYVNPAPCDYPVYIKNVAQCQMPCDYPMASSMITFEGSTTKLYAPPSSSIQATDDAQDDILNDIDYEDYPLMQHCQITFD